MVNSHCHITLTLLVLTTNLIEDDHDFIKMYKIVLKSAHFHKSINVIIIYLFVSLMLPPHSPFSMLVRELFEGDQNFLKMYKIHILSFLQITKCYGSFLFCVATSLPLLALAKKLFEGYRDFSKMYKIVLLFLKISKFYDNLVFCFFSCCHNTPPFNFNDKLN